MSSIKLITDNYKFEDNEGNVILEAPLMDVYCLISLAAEEQQDSRKEKMVRAAKALNDEYGTSFTWGETLILLNSIDEEIQVAKKNSKSTPESPIGTE